METNNRLQRLRIAKGYTQKRLAKEAGLTERAIQNYEYTTRQPKGKYLSRLATALNVPEDALRNDDVCDKVCKEIHSNQTENNKKDIPQTARKVSGVALITARSSLIAAGSGMILGFSTMIGVVLTLATATTFVASKWLNEKEKKEANKSLLKEQQRIENLLIIIREKMDRIMDEYAQLAIKVQQDNASIDEYEQLNSINKKIKCIQEYRELLKMKAYDISLLIDESKNKELINHTVNEITELEKKEHQITELLKEVIE